MRLVGVIIGVLAGYALVRRLLSSRAEGGFTIPMRRKTLIAVQD